MKKNFKNTNITHILKLIFEAYKKKNFFFCIYKNDKYYKKTKKSFEKKHAKDIKIFQKKKKKKGEKRLEPVIKIFLKKKKKENVSIIMNVIKIFLKNKKKIKLSI